MATALVVDDDRTILHLVSESLKELGVETLTAGTASEGLKLLECRRPDVALLDVMLPEVSGLELFHTIHRIDAKLPVIFITSADTGTTAIEAMQAGAFDFLPKPLDLANLNDLVRQAVDTRRLMEVPVAVRTTDASADEGDLFLGACPEMIDVFKSIGRVAGQDVTVLVRGESGTGKELVARAIYQHSPRSDRTFVAVNCAALSDSLLESELFGHEKGAFTGAEQQRIGKFEQCHGGTIFLDEVGDMSALLQSKVLRLLQDQRFERVGGNETIQTDVRVIAATNRDLETMVENGEFRIDLFYRLNGVSIALPPLRDRAADLPRLLEHFLSRACESLGKPDIEGLSPDALRILTRYAWPGNVRELQSVVDQMVLAATGPVIVPDCLPHEVRDLDPSDQETVPSDVEGIPPSDLAPFIEEHIRHGSTSLYEESVEFMEKYLITRVLNETGGNQSKAAERLGITRGKLRDRIISFGINLDRIVGLDDE